MLFMRSRTTGLQDGHHDQTQITNHSTEAINRPLSSQNEQISYLRDFTRATGGPSSTVQPSQVQRSAYPTSHAHFSSDLALVRRSAMSLLGTSPTYTHGPRAYPTESVLAGSKKGGGPIEFVVESLDGQQIAVYLENSDTTDDINRILRDRSQSTDSLFHHRNPLTYNSSITTRPSIFANPLRCMVTVPMARYKLVKAGELYPQPSVRRSDTELPSKSTYRSTGSMSHARSTPDDPMFFDQELTSAISPLIRTRKSLPASTTTYQTQPDRLKRTSQGPPPTLPLPMIKAESPEAGPFSSWTGLVLKRSESSLHSPQPLSKRALRRKRRKTMAGEWARNEESTAQETHFPHRKPYGKVRASYPNNIPLKGYKALGRRDAFGSSASETSTCPLIPKNFKFWSYSDNASMMSDTAMVHPARRGQLHLMQPVESAESKKTEADEHQISSGGEKIKGSGYSQAQENEESQEVGDKYGDSNERVSADLDISNWDAR